MHKEITTQYEALAELCVEKTKAGISSIEKQNGDHAIVKIQGIYVSFEQGTESSDSGVTKTFFKKEGHVPQPLMQIQRVGKLMLDHVVAPIVGTGALYTVVLGSIAFSAIRIETLLEDGKVIETVNQWLDEKENLEEKLEPMVVVPPGTSVWIPYGYLPVIMGNPSSLDEGFVSYYVQYLCDDAAVECHTKPVAIEIAAWQTKSFLRDSKALKSVQPLLDAFAEKLKSGPWLEKKDDDSKKDDVEIIETKKKVGDSQKS